MGAIKTMEMPMNKTTTRIARHRTDRHEFMLVRWNETGGWYITRQPINRKTGEPWQATKWLGQWHTVPSPYYRRSVYAPHAAERYAKEAWAKITGSAAQ
jgi:hypothetical protein